MAPAKRRRTAASTAPGRGQVNQSKLSFRSTKAGSKETTGKAGGKSKIHTSDKEEGEFTENLEYSAERGVKSASVDDSKTVETDEVGQELIKEPQQLDENEASDDAIALAINDSEIKRYWQAKERERKAPRVHQEGLTTHDRVLREFDMTAKFGPSIGITRLVRWRRAKEIGLAPPFEVLSILLRENQNQEDAGQKSIVDELMMTSRNEVIVE